MCSELSDDGIYDVELQSESPFKTFCCNSRHCSSTVQEYKKTRDGRHVLLFDNGSEDRIFLVSHDGLERLCTAQTICVDGKFHSDPRLFPAFFLSFFLSVNYHLLTLHVQTYGNAYQFAPLTYFRCVCACVCAYMCACMRVCV